MARIHIPEFNDLAGYEAAAGEIAAAHAQVQESWLLWSIMSISSVMERHPPLGSIGLPVGEPFRPRMERGHGATRILMGTRLAKTTPKPTATWNGSSPELRAKAWTPVEIESLRQAELALRAWDGDPRMHAFFDAMRSAHPRNHSYAWIDRGDGIHPSQALCAGLGRLDLWPRIEAGLVAASSASAQKAGSMRI